jgi:rubrerythrin
MQLDSMLKRCRTLEERAAAIYRTFAAGARHVPELCAVWTALAREEEEHGRSLACAAAQPPPPHVRLEGWEEALAIAEERVAVAERLGAGAGADRQLAAALELEMSELEVMRHTLLAASGRRPPAPSQEDHAVRLAEFAARASDDPQVRLQAALVRARAALKPTV